ncbi:alpha/beta hydrolase, partial [Streptomyces sp. NPDC000151]|uniref:alpha/beta hydrolase n=1 Tax=Streptomyces sp. NPDC000151 TaxID=3154244 RepID=UPI00332F3FAB
MSREPDEEEALLACAPVPPDGRIAYGDHPDQVIDLYRPPEAPPGRRSGPLIVLLHGGFWRVAYDRTHLSPLAAALAREGLPVALAEYRRAGGGGGFPETFNDVTNAVRAAAAEAGAHASVVLAGHSAGGHLALWAA